MQVTTSTGATVEQLIDEITRIPVQPGAAMRLMRMLDDPRSSAEALGKVIESDASLSARLIQLANTSFYGLSAPVSSAWRAVTVVGLATLRSVVATAVLDIGTAEGLSVPEGFWSHSVGVAAASGLLAPRMGVDPGEAFSAGLLHDVGIALVFRRARERYDDIAARAVDSCWVVAEHDALGVDHCELSARAVRALGFSDVAGAAVAQHHRPGDLDAFASVLRAADLLAAMVQDEAVPEAERDVDEALAAVNVAEHERQPLYQRVCELVDDLETLLGGS
jgi:putative nucleotidyltransferase with HDIG domain